MNASLLEGGTVREQQQELNAILFPMVQFHGEVADASKASRLEVIATRLASAIKAIYMYERNEYEADKDDRLTHLTWNVGVEKDAAVVTRLRKVTGHKCAALFDMGRLLAGLCYVTRPNRLTIFQTSESTPLRLHMDSDQIGMPDPAFRRTIVHLSGARRELSFKVGGIEVETYLKQGEAYTLHPDSILHGARYHNSATALYVQSR